MGEPLELYNIVGDSANGEDCYEVPHPLAREEERYTNLQFNASDGPASNRTGCCKHVSEVRQLLIVFGVLLMIVIGSSITIVVLLVSYIINHLMRLETKGKHLTTCEYKHRL